MNALETLIELTSKKADELSKSLSEARRNVESSKTKLQALNQYRTDYGLKLEQTMSAGITPTAHQNYRAFMAKLSAAVSSQEVEIRHRELILQRILAELQECERKKLSYKTIVSRNALRAATKATKAEQKMFDEIATRTAMRRITEETQ